MKPPMTDIVKILVPSDTKDRFGKYIKEELTSVGRVTYIDKVVETEDGKKHRASVEIDLPPEAIVGYNYSIIAKAPNGKEQTYNVLNVQGSPTLGNRVLFWTVQLV